MSHAIILTIPTFDKENSLKIIIIRKNAFCKITIYYTIYHTYVDCTGVIHFAALKAVGKSVAIPLKYYRNNLTSLINTLEMMSEFNIPNIVFSSSATVYGDLDTLPVPEDTPLKPATFPYGQTAAGIREKLSVFGDDYDTPNEFCVRNYIDINDLADATRANNVLGWHAHRELTETLRNAWNWQKNYQ